MTTKHLSFNNRLRAACYAFRSIKSYMSQEVIKMVYYAYFHATVSNGIVFWRNLESTNIFKMQKRKLELLQEARIQILPQIYFKT
jgi:hypothetical protein